MKYKTSDGTCCNDDAVTELPQGAVLLDDAAWAVRHGIPVSDADVEAIRRLNTPVKTYRELRAAAYPPITDYLEAVVSGDPAQVQAYIDTCKAVKARFPEK